MKKIILTNLLLNYQKGDMAAFERIYSEMFYQVCTIAFSIVPDKYFAEDVAQETFIKIQRQIQNFGTPYNGFAWIYSIARNTALNMLAKTNCEDINEAVDGIMDTCSFEDSIDDRELLATMFRILDSTERKIVLLHLTTGMKHKEIANMLNVPLGTVLSKYNRSLKKLQEAGRTEK